MTAIIKDSNFIKVADNVKPDSKNRVIIRKALMQEGITYHIYANSTGQIILDPQVSIPASEYWLFANQDALASVKRGLADAAQGRVTKVDIDNL